MHREAAQQDRLTANERRAEAREHGVPPRVRQAHVVGMWSAALAALVITRAIDHPFAGRPGPHTDHPIASVVLDQRLAEQFRDEPPESAALMEIEFGTTSTRTMRSRRSIRSRHSSTWAQNSGMALRSARRSLPGSGMGYSRQYRRISGGRVR